MGILYFQDSPEDFVFLVILVRVLYGTNICIFIYYEELVYTIIEAEKSHDLLWVSWRPRKLFQSRKVGVSCPSQFRGLGTETNGIILVPGQEETDIPARESGREREFSLPPPFVLSMSSSQWPMPIRIR